MSVNVTSVRQEVSQVRENITHRGHEKTARGVVRVSVGFVFILEILTYKRNKQLIY